MAIVRHWTQEDIDKLKDLAAKGASALRCAAALKRNQASVKKQARSLGIVLQGVREVRATTKARIAKAERDLPREMQRFDGSYAK